MWTTTLGQLINKLILDSLCEAVTKEHAEMAPAQAKIMETATAIDIYLWECLQGRHTHRPFCGQGFYDAHAVEAWRRGKKATPEAPPTLGTCVASLARQQGEIWEKKGRIHGLKMCIDHASNGLNSDRPVFESELVQVQRQVDLGEQQCSELIERIDTLFAALLDTQVKVDTLPVSDQTVKDLIAKLNDVTRREQKVTEGVEVRS